MSFPAPLRLPGFSLRLTKGITSQLLAVSLICALCLQCVLLPLVAIARLSPDTKTTATDKQIAENEATSAVTNGETNSGASSSDSS